MKNLVTVGWQDFDRDGVIDSSELKTLDALGIVSLDTRAQALDTTIPQGARLTRYGDVVKQSCRVAAACNDNDGSAWPERPLTEGRVA